MAMFKYNALTSSERLMKGTIEASSRDEANELLSQMQLSVNSIEQAKAPKPKTSIGRNEFLLFNQQLASITKAGIPLERGLRELSSDITSRSMRKLIDAIADDLESGLDIEEAFNKRQKHFPPLYGRILKAGVETGRLSEMLASLNRHLEVAGQTRRIIFEAISYPAIILVMASVIITGLLLLIVPQFESILREILGGMRMHPMTRAIFAMADNVLYVWAGLGILIAFLIFVYSILSSSSQGRRFKESIILKIPVLGKIHHSSILCKMSESMALMVAANCDMPTALRLSATTTGSETIILESEILASQVEKGTNILEAGQFCKVIPKLFLYSIQLGTQRDELQDNLYSLGQMYSGQVRCGQSRLQAVFLPIMLIILGTVVFMIILGMFMPMIQIITGLSNSVS